ncbi:MAG: N-acetyltransferase family protein [Oscillospiraceae bacterium]
MEAVITKAAAADLPAVAQIYEDIIARQDRGGPLHRLAVRGVSHSGNGPGGPGEGRALRAAPGEKVVGSAIINQTQVDVYAQAAWQYPAQDSQVMVLHTLVIDPSESAHGYGGQFAAFYEAYAAQNGCPYLRIDTNARNEVARKFYKKLGYREVGIVPCRFNGLPDVDLVMLEKKIY